MAQARQPLVRLDARGLWFAADLFGPLEPGLDRLGRAGRFGGGGVLALDQSAHVCCTRYL